MPFINSSSYKAKGILKNPHFQIIYPYFFRPEPKYQYENINIKTPDNDYINLNHSISSKNDHLIIISHGLEGSTKSPYISWMSKYCFENNFDCIAWNMRSCSGDINLQKRFYHSGTVDDLETVINWALEKKSYNRISLIGFSLGGNITTLYVSKYSNQISSKISSAVCISTPLCIKSAGEKLSEKQNRFYFENFMKTIKNKILEKSKMIDLNINLNELNKIKSFYEFDKKYTAPIHNFKNVKEFYYQTSPIYHLDRINIPVLIINALDDPFLPNISYPYDEAKNNKNLFLETPHHGGHMGFVEFSQNKHYWGEIRAIEFIKYYL